MNKNKNGAAGLPVSATRITTYHGTLPGDANNEGNLFGGNLMRLLDLVGFFSAVRHARCRLVTAALSMSFRDPVRMGDMIISHASVNAVWHSSMEVGVRVETEHPYTGEVRHVATCYLTYVAVDEKGRPIPLAPLILETDEDRRRMGDATRRAAVSRLEQKLDSASVSGLRMLLLPESFSIFRLDKDAPLPDLAGCGEDPFMSLTRTSDELSLILTECAAGKLSARYPDLTPQSGYACIKVLEDDLRNKVGMLAGLSTLLASVQVPLVTVSTYDSFYLLMRREFLEKVLERLTSAGHTISG